MRLGFCMVQGLREEVGRRLESGRLVRRSLGEGGTPNAERQAQNAVAVDLPPPPRLRRTSQVRRSAPGRCAGLPQMRRRRPVDVRDRRARRWATPVLRRLRTRLGRRACRRARGSEGRPVPPKPPSEAEGAKAEGRMPKAVSVRFSSLDALVAATGIRRDELNTLASLGALNAFGTDRRGALWEAERVVRPTGDLFAMLDEEAPPVSVGRAEVGRAGSPSGPLPNARAKRGSRPSQRRGDGRLRTAGPTCPRRAEGRRPQGRYRRR